MKSGASDPFADDEDESTQTTTTEGEETNSSRPTEASDSAENSATPDPELDQPPATDRLASTTGQFNRSDLPYILRRDKVKDERDDVHQLFVMSETDTTEESARRNLADRFEEDVYKLDAREAIYRAGMQNLHDAEVILREWGYDL